MLYFGQFAVLGLASALLLNIWQQRSVSAAQPVAVTALSPELTQTEPLAVSTAGFADAVERASPAVVNILANREEQVVVTDPQVSRFTGRRVQRSGTLRRSELGAGVIGSADGYVITNLHIVAGDNVEIRVALSNGRVLPAAIIGRDPATDLAVLKVDSSQPLPTAVIADTSQLRVGEVALAIGNPFGLGKTVTQGIISATGRGELGVSDFADLIQTDAAINRGNSGGALINTKGELIGINTAILDRRDAEGIGFAIPIETALDVMQQLIDTGFVQRGWLGVRWDDGRLHPRLVRQARGQPGHVIAEIMPDGPAHRAGLAIGDYVVGAAGQAVGRLRDLLQNEADTPPGGEITLEYWRDGALYQTTATVIQRPPSSS